MNPLIQLKKAAPVFFVALVCFGFLPTMQAVTPTPDGVYPGGNTAEGGSGALFSLTTGTNNTAVGSSALFSLTTGIQNTAVGAQALKNNTANDNTAEGFQTLVNNTTGFGNTATGWRALFQNATGFHNTADGFSALLRNTAGNHNTANGDEALGSNSSGKLGTITSSRRFKEEIKPMGQASEALFALKPVIFRYKKEIEPQKIPQFGLVAEDVEAVNPDLVVRDADGKAYTVRYEAVNAMLLNEFLKAHRKAQQQEATITELKRGIEI